MFLLSLLIVFSGTLSTPALAHVSSEDVESTLNSILKKYPNGSYFSVDGKPCPHSSKSTGGNHANCSLYGVLAAEGISVQDIYRDAWTCWAFTRYVSFKLYGWDSLYVASKQHPNGLYRVATGLTTSAATFSNAKKGDIIWFYGNTSCTGNPVHMGIFISASSKGIIIYDNNIGGNEYHTGYVRYGEVAYGSLPYSDGSCVIYRPGNYDTGSVTQPQESTLAITPNSYPTGTLNQGSTFPLSGTVTSNYMITSFKGEIINSSGSIVDTASQTASTKALSIRRSKVDMGLEFDKLAGGTYYLRYTATDSSGKTATWKSSAFTVNGASSKTCTVTFDANGGSVSQTSKTVAAGNLIGDLPMPTRTGYTFLGWSTVKTGSMMLVTADNFYVQQDETLYAIWRKEASRVTRTTQLDVRNMETTSNSAEGWSWNKETKTLTLDNVNFAVSDQPSALIIGSATIILNGENTIKSTYNNSKDNYNTTGIYAINGHLAFEGDGSLTASGGTSGGDSIGIAAGLSGTGSVTINSGSVTAIGGTSTGFGSCGIRTPDLTINGGSFTAIGGTAPSSSRGVYIYSGTLNVNGGIFKASSGATQNSRSLPGAAAGVYAGQGGSINIGPSVRIVEPANSDVVEIDSRNRATSILNMSGEPAKDVIIQEIGK